MWLQNMGCYELYLFKYLKSNTNFKRFKLPPHQVLFFPSLPLLSFAFLCFLLSPPTHFLPFSGAITLLPPCFPWSLTPIDPKWPHHTSTAPVLSVSLSTRSKFWVYQEKNIPFQHFGDSFTWPRYLQPPPLAPPTRVKTSPAPLTAAPRSAPSDKKQQRRLCCWR